MEIENLEFDQMKKIVIILDNEEANDILNFLKDAIEYTSCSIVVENLKEKLEGKVIKNE